MEQCPLVIEGAGDYVVVVHRAARDDLLSFCENFRWKMKMNVDAWSHREEERRDEGVGEKREEDEGTLQTLDDRLDVVNGVVRHDLRQVILGKRYFLATVVFPNFRSRADHFAHAPSFLLDDVVGWLPVEVNVEKEL